MSARPLFRSSEPGEVASLGELERRVGRLPMDYRSFLLTTNGGYPEPNCVGMPDGSAQEARMLLGLRPGTDLDLDQAIRTYRGRLPEGVLPIGADSCGNLFALAIGTHTPGTVFFWDHELEADEHEEPVFTNLALVASSFTSFLDSFQECPPVPEPKVISVWIDPKFLALQKAKGNAK